MKGKQVNHVSLGASLEEPGKTQSQPCVSYFGFPGVCAVSHGPKFLQWYPTAINDGTTGITPAAG